MLFRITVVTSTSRTNAYLTLSRFFIDEIANSKYSLMSSSPMEDISSKTSWRLIKLRNLKEKLDKLQTTHLKRLSAHIKRRIRLGGRGNRINKSWIFGSCGKRSVSIVIVVERYLILRVRACCTALLVSLLCEANVRSMSSDGFRVLNKTKMTNVDRTWASKARLNCEQTSRSVFSLRQSRSCQWPS